MTDRRPFHRAGNPQFLRGIVLSLAAYTTLAGCQLFWRVQETHPAVQGTWEGQVVAVTLYDGEGQACPVPIAGLWVEKGTAWQDWNPDPRYPLQPRPIVVLSKDGRHAAPLSGFPVGATVRAAGTVRYATLRSPEGEREVDDVPHAKNLHPTSRAVAVRFLDLSEPVQMMAEEQPTHP